MPLAPARHPANEGLKISSNGLDMVKQFESFFPKAYWDKTGKVWTIGYGHTGLQHKDGTVFEGRKVTHDEALELLDYDMDQFESRVRSLVTVPLTQDQFDTLVSWDFNTGGLTVAGGKPSTLLRKLNAGDYAGAAREFPKWRKSGGVVLKGLERRRGAERRLFEGKNWQAYDAPEKQWRKLSEWKVGV
jgi:lysozyme